MSDSLVLNWTGVIQPADRELTASEIKRRFGGLLQSGVRAFRDDPQLLVDLAEEATRLRHQRELREAKAQVRAAHPEYTTDEVTQCAQEALSCRGVVAPTRTKRTRSAA